MQNNSMNKQKDDRYKELIDEVTASWQSRTVTKPLMCWCEFCKRINLWSYWQGSLDADIMVVGQDWGKPYTGESSDKRKRAKELADNIMKMNYGIPMSTCNVGIESHYPTDNNLKKLFRQITVDGQSIYDDIMNTQYSSLLFTNFCLGTEMRKKREI